MVDEYLKGPDPRARAGSPDGLTLRECGILRLIAEGQTSKEIAWLLDLSVKTIEAHRTRIMSKLRIHNVAGLTRYAISRGISSLERRG
ncbi:MAG TPA: LuxR C-terminal-related transcriptional regulator [Candidatus Polarisedimenticolia bacterium]|nr:LuxR C-terminal-related transcriptional regulator [Candidatus Polarisedimenticolia bacterium]